MTLDQLVLFLLEVFGVVYVTTASVIAAPLRLLFVRRVRVGPFWRVLIYCPKCQAFWIGAALALWKAPDDVVGIVRSAVIAMGAVAALPAFSTWANDAYAVETYEEPVAPGPMEAS